MEVLNSIGVAVLMCCIVIMFVYSLVMILGKDTHVSEGDCPQAVKESERQAKFIKYTPIGITVGLLASIILICA